MGHRLSRQKPPPDPALSSEGLRLSHRVWFAQFPPLGKREACRYTHPAGLGARNGRFCVWPQRWLGRLCDPIPLLLSISRGHKCFPCFLKHCQIYLKHKRIANSKAAARSSALAGICCHQNIWKKVPSAVQREPGRSLASVWPPWVSCSVPILLRDAQAGGTWIPSPPGTALVWPSQLTQGSKSQQIAFIS